MKKTLITCATHGDEGFSIPVAQRIAKKYKCSFRINNPKAYRQNKRFIDTDMNRSGPGKWDVTSYEVRKSLQNIKFASKYDRVIDIHGTVSQSGLFIILSDPNWQNIEFAKQIPLKRIVLWPSLQPTGPLTQFIPNSLEIECGPKDDPKIAKELEKVLENYFSGTAQPIKQEFFIVTGIYKTSSNKPMQDFVPYSIGKTSFYPLLVDQYPGIKCYQLQKLQNTLEY